MELFAKTGLNNLLAFPDYLMPELRHQQYFCILNSNRQRTKFAGNFDMMIAAGHTNFLSINENDKNAFQLLRSFHKDNNDWLFGHLSYDLKNETEDLQSNNIDNINMAAMTFFSPLVLIKIKNNIAEFFISEKKRDAAIELAERLMEKTKPRNKSPEQKFNRSGIIVKNRMSKEDYFRKFEKIKKHIQYGDIYEMNFCQEFYAEDAELDPYSYYIHLNKLSPAPFSVFYRTDGNYLISSSPERYLRKTGNRIISQPIKGTAPRHPDPAKDKASKQKLESDPKERAENVMIVDLVRNDLSRTAAKGSVKVEELCGIYSFSQVHQMISTVTSTLDSRFDFVDLLSTTFPMGSMTGAPKIRAMELIEDYEETKRGLYSGAVGYITPDGDFDFNVVIRSVLYNSKTKYLSFITGGAITSGSTAEREYNECLLKAKAITESLK
jgi:para-aminobenzoate synthetase component 1